MLLLLHSGQVTDLMFHLHEERKMGSQLDQQRARFYDQYRKLSQFYRVGRQLLLGDASSQLGILGFSTPPPHFQRMCAALLACRPW